MQIDSLLDAARSNSGLSNDAALASALGIKPASLSQYRTKRSWPTDETQVRLCHLAGVAPEIGLLWLNIWRSHGRARVVYQQLSAKLGGAALSIFIVFMAFGVDSAQAAVNPALSAVQSVQNAPQDFILWKILTCNSWSWRPLSLRCI